MPQVSFQIPQLACVAQLEQQKFPRNRCLIFYWEGRDAESETESEHRRAAKTRAPRGNERAADVLLSTNPDAMHHPAASLQIAPAAALLSIRSMSDMAPMRHGLTLVVLLQERMPE